MHVQTGACYTEAVPTVFEDLKLPSEEVTLAEVDIHLANSQCTRTTGFDSEDHIIGVLDLRSGRGISSTTGRWETELVGNADIEPAGTQYRIQRSSASMSSVSCIIVPSSGGPYSTRELLVDPLDPLPTAEPSNELDVAELFVNSPVVTGDTGLHLVPVEDMIVTVPDVNQPVYIEVDSQLRIANDQLPAIASAAVAPAGTEQIQIDEADMFGPRPMPILGDLPVDAAVALRHRLEPNSPGDWQLYISAHDNTDIGFGIPSAVPVRVSAADHVPTRMTVLAV